MCRGGMRFKKSFFSTYKLRQGCGVSPDLFCNDRDGLVTEVWIGGSYEEMVFKSVNIGV